MFGYHQDRCKRLLRGPGNTDGMIIDLQTRIWTSPAQLGKGRPSGRSKPLASIEADLNAHEQAMACVDIVAVHGFRADRLEASIPNEYIAELTRSNPARLFGIGGIDPTGPDPLGQVEQVLDLGLHGVTLSPMEAGFHPSNSVAMRVYDRCASKKLPVFINHIHPLTPRCDMTYGHPAGWDDVAQEYPTLPIVLGGIGYPWINEALLLMSKHDHVHATVDGMSGRPWLLYNTLLDATGMDVMHKLLFASGFPFDQPQDLIEMIYSINGIAHGTRLPTINRETIRGIVESDSISMLGLELDPRAAIPPAEQIGDAQDDRVAMDTISGEDTA